MLVKKTQRKWSKEEKERILLDIQNLGVIAGCRKHSLQPTVYYDWLEKYNALGLDGLDGSRSKNQDAVIKRLTKELALAKEIIAEKELELKLKGDLLKKRIVEWKKGGKS